MSRIVDFAYMVRVAEAERHVPYDKQCGHGCSQLTLVEKRDVFSGKAMRWVNHILVYAGIEGMLVLAVMVGQIWLSPSRFLMAAMGVDGQMFPYVVLAVGVAALLLIAAFELLMVVMRSLLMQAIEQRDELAAVI